MPPPCDVDLAKLTFQNGFEDKELFDSAILQELDFSTSLATYKPPISIIDPGENLLMRALRLSDFDKGTAVTFYFHNLNFRYMYIGFLW